MQKSAFNKFKIRQRRLGWLGFAVLALLAVCFAVPTFGLSLVALVAPKLFLALAGAAHHGVGYAAAGMFGGVRLLRKADSGEGGSSVMEEGEFQGRVLRGVESLTEENKKLRSDVQKITDDFARSDKEVKQAMEELTKVKNASNSSAEDIAKRMERLQKQIVLNARSSFRNPIERALATNEELRFMANAFARYVIAQKYGHSVDPAFKKAVDDANAKTKSLTGVDASLGQATVPQETFNEIYDLLLQYGDYSTLGVMKCGMRTTVLPVATARPQFYWIGSQTGQGEGSVITSGSFSGSQVLLIIQTLAVLMYVARELLQDSTVELAPYVIRQMIESCNWGMDTAAFLGTGNQDQANAGYVGVFNAALANTNLGVSAGPGRTTVGIMKLDDFVATILNVSAEVLNRKPMWWAHPQQMARIALIRDNNGRPIFQTWQEVPNPGSVGSILGYPVHPTAIAPSTDGPSSVAIAFGDPEGLAVGIRTDLELATSEDIGFPQNLMAYRTLLRAGVKMKTLPNSTTLKPFSVLSTSAE